MAVRRPPPPKLPPRPAPPPPPRAPAVVNTQAGNPRQGLSYTVQKAPGGTVHVYPGGAKVFVKAGAPRPAAPGAVPPPTPAAPGAEAPVTPDSEYAYDESQDTFDAAQAESDYVARKQMAEAQYTEALRRMQEQRPKDEQSAREAANRQGLFYSGQLGKQLGDLATNYTERQADLAAARDSANLDALQQLRDVGARRVTGEQGHMAGAVDRQIVGDTQAADAGGLVQNPAPAIAALNNVAKKAAAPAPTYKNVVKKGNLYHFYPNGRKVYVRPAARR